MPFTNKITIRGIWLCWAVVLATLIQCQLVESQYSTYPYFGAQGAGAGTGYGGLYGNAYGYGYGYPQYYGYPAYGYTYPAYGYPGGGYGSYPSYGYPGYSYGYPYGNGVMFWTCYFL
ncbi:prisilkin-39 isoform X2 [Drosophila albomicans]|uniref:Prisilkin-39 isoform X2 n=1 Tax=Drosophila albomicans TaxID=7291 RepID=A0A9C6T4N5_DROAB|nr:prisilkin-39 isoform X2 [Drosophila albomicans]